ncbi:hypothetical protein [Rhodococcus chondri]|uniref:Uncharacterized protein n=1 Tax=Rhodococcus chondri TaxID=3065941 RepID=A0ABU7JU28_9NOCA|nr:hypothetical protein [Rhodococcus sp. CC-R104]MEE2033527.1 hypothetical protein [Rhodococcus sp. CC-R104]
MLALITTVASQAALITALLYYFGWVRTRATFDYFGVDVSLLGFSTTDYVLRSLNSALRPLLVAGLVVVAALAARRPLLGLVDGLARNRTRRLRIIAVLTIVAVSLSMVVLNGLSDLDTARYTRGYPLPSAVLGVAASVAVARHLCVPGTDARPAGGGQEAHARIWALTLATLALAGAVWGIALYAHQLGEQRAVQLAGQLRRDAQVLLYSVDRLAIDGPGVVVDTLTQDGSRYAYRYSGLRLLIRSDGRYLFVPAGWRKGVDSVFVIDAEQSVRIDVIAQ